MEPKKERESASEFVNSSGENIEAETSPTELPPVGELPQPPVVNYTRPALKRGQYAERPDEHIGVSEEQAKINTVARLGSGLSAGITFASSVIVSVLIGMWLDRHVDPKSPTPWATIVMLIIGFAAGFITFVRISSVADRNTKSK